MAWHRLTPGLPSGPGRRAATVTLSRHALSVTVRRAAADGAVPRPRAGSDPDPVGHHADPLLRRRRCCAAATAQ